MRRRGFQVVAPKDGIAFVQLHGSNVAWIPSVLGILLTPERPSFAGNAES